MSFINLRFDKKIQSNRKGISILLLMFGFSTILGQSKKERIEYLQFKIDSLTLACSEDHQNQTSLNVLLQQEISIQRNTLENSNKINKTLNDSLFQTTLKNASQLKAIDKLETEVRLLRMQAENETETFYDVDYLMSSGYASEINENYEFERFFDINVKAILEKEKSRIKKSTFAKRINNNLHITSHNKPLVLRHKSEYEGIQQVHYSYLFEDLRTEKLYCAQISFIYAGGGTETSSLLEIDLQTGNIHVLSPNQIGGDFFFNPNNTFAVIGGWFNDGDGLFPLKNKFCIVNLDERKTDLTIENVELMNLKWLTETSFKCQVVHYEMNTDNQEPYYYRPENYLIPFTLYSFKDDKWVASELK
jgi:hypothetical protein